MSDQIDHIDEKMRELEHRFEEMKALHAEFLNTVFNGKEVNVRPFQGQSGEVARRFRYAFSAYLSVHRTIRYYIIRRSGKISGTTEWRSAIDQRPVLDALHHLRDVDIHDSTLNAETSIKISGLQTASPSVNIDPLRLDPDCIKSSRRFSSRDSALRYVTEHAMLEIAADGLREITDVVGDGRARGYI